MDIFYQCKEILKIQKFRRMVSYAGFYCFITLITYAYTSNTTRAGISRADQYYASYPAGTELLTDTAKLYKAALGNCFEIDDWGPIEFSIMARHFDRQGKPPYAYHAQYTPSIPWPTRWKRLTAGCVLVDSREAIRNTCIVGIIVTMGLYWILYKRAVLLKC